jgi:hypothetical protein
MDESIQKAISRARSKVHDNRTAMITMRVSPDEKRLIEEKFGGPAGLRDYAVGVSSSTAVDVFIDDFRERLERLERVKADEVD